MPRKRRRYFPWSLKCRKYRKNKKLMAERGRFELPIPLRVCRISSAVHSTTLPPLRTLRDIRKSSRATLVEVALLRRFAAEYPRASASLQPSRGVVNAARTSIAAAAPLLCIRPQRGAPASAAATGSPAEAGPERVEDQSPSSMWLQALPIGALSTICAAIGSAASSKSDITAAACPRRGRTSAGRAAFFHGNADHWHGLIVRRQKSSSVPFAGCTVRGWGWGCQRGAL